MRLRARLVASLAFLASTQGFYAQTPAPAPATPSQVPSEPASPQSPQVPQPAGLGAGSQAVKNPDGTYTVRRTSRLVVLDTVVTDQQGNSVTGLSRDAFHVTESGDPQTILSFDEAGARKIAPDVTINSTQDLDRLAPRAPVNIILLDEFNTRFEDMAFARYSLKQWLKKQPDKLDTPTMLLAVSLQKFEVLRDYTQDKQGILDALDHHFAVLPWQARGNSWAAERYGTAFQTLQRVSEAVVGHPGHKTMIWIGRGFPALNFANVPIDTQNRVDTIVQETVNRLRDARVTLYTIDPAGLLTDQMAYGSDAALNDPFGGNYQFAKLAVATGGRALYGRNDVDAEIGKTIRDGATFYTLTYRPDNDSRDPQKFRRIKVKVEGPGLMATTREGYYLQRPAAQVSPTSPSRRLVTDLVAAETSTMVYDGLPMKLVPTATPYHYIIHVDGQGVAWRSAEGTNPRRAELIVMVSTFDKKGKELKRDARNLQAAAPASAAPSGRINVPVNIPYDFEHGAKAVRARIVVRMSGSGRIATADLDLVNPAKPPEPVAPDKVPSAPSPDAVQPQVPPAK